MLDSDGKWSQRYQVTTINLSKVLNTYQIQNNCINIERNMESGSKVNNNVLFTFAIRFQALSEFI